MGCMVSGGAEPSRSCPVYRLSACRRPEACLSEAAAAARAGCAAVERLGRLFSGSNTRILTPLRRADAAADEERRVNAQTQGGGDASVPCRSRKEGLPRRRSPELLRRGWLRSESRR